MADERFTEFHVLYDMSDITALEDSTPATTFNSEFANLSLLKAMDIYPAQMTLEHNYSVLDERYDEFADDATHAFFSNVMSNADGEFTVGTSDTPNNPTIIINFTELHSSYGLTINFIDDYPLELKCTWYQNDLVMYSDTFEVTKNNFIIDQDVANYNKIKLEFTKALPYRYIKISYIRYGVLIHWDENDIKTGNLALETDRLSNQLSINTLDFSVVDTTDTTNPGNTTGLHNYFQRTQIMYPYEIINGNKIDLGKYFLDSFSYERNITKINAISYMGLFDTTPYNKGGIYNGVEAGTVLADIFSVLGITNYTVDTDTASQLLYGTIAPMSCKKALEAVLFACHSVIDTTDMENIKIYKSTESVAGTLRRGDKLNTKVTKTNYISGVEVKYNIYALSSDTSEVVKGTYDLGVHTVVLSTACTNYSISSNASIISEGTSPYVVKFEVTTAGEVTITANQYQSTENAITVSRPYIEAGEGSNIKSYSTTLCNQDTAKVLATKILAYYDNRLEIDVKYFANTLNMNERWIIENPTPGMDNYIGIFTERDIDLTGGFIDNAKFIGVFDKDDYQYFAKDIEATSDTHCMDNAELISADYVARPDSYPEVI